MNEENNSNLVNKKSKNAFFKKIGGVVSSFSLTEKLIFGIFFIIFIISSLFILININKSFLVEIPNNGGSINEGIIGTPRFINPIIAVSTADKDLTALVYSGLMRKNPDGGFIPDLADRYEVSEDGLEYRFYIRDNAEFHDGKPVTSDDVVFTILKAQDPELESFQRPNWESVVLERISDKEIVFRLKQPSADFIEGTTIGILPRHLWEDILSGGFSLSKYNTEPIGSGPYKLSKIRRDSTDIPTSYTLKSFSNYTLGKPFIKKINLYFAKNEAEILEMFNNGLISSFGGLSPMAASEISSKKIRLSLPRVFGIFFNQNEAKILADKSVREALQIATPKSEIINEVLFGFAETSNNAIPTHLALNPEIGNVDDNSDEEGDTSANEADDSDSNNSRILAAQEILEGAGWKKNEDGLYIKETDDENFLLSFDISTSNISELNQVAEKVIENWRAVGIDVSLKAFENSDLNQNVIRPRNFESLLFGMIIDNYTDLYAFWHSSQRTDPGLNITGYANITIDDLLEDLRNATNQEEQKSIVTQFNSELTKDIPAIFLYTPEFIYVVPDNINGIEVDNIKSADDRFMNVNKWFINTDKVWKVFK